MTLDVDSSESPVHGAQEQSAYNGHFESVCYHPLFVFNPEGDCLAAKLRPGNVHSADGWDEVLLPIIDRYRAAWQRPELVSGWAAQGPMLLALTITLSILTFFTKYTHPVVYPAAGAGHPYGGSEGLGVASILLQTMVLMGTILFVVRFSTLPAGALTLMVTLNAAAMGFLTFQGAYPVALVIAAGAGGLLADLLRAQLRPMAGRPAAWRLFAFVVPAVFSVCYFLALILTEDIAWSVHLWTGSIMLSGVAGWLLSYLLLPSRSSEVAPGGL